MKYTGTRCSCDGPSLLGVGKGGWRIHGPEAEPQKLQRWCSKDRCDRSSLINLWEAKVIFLDTGAREYQMITEVAKLKPVTTRKPENLHGTKII